MGQVTLGSLGLGDLRSGYIGYWIAREAAGRGVMPRAVAMVTDHGLGTLGLHRIEINIRPENSASLRVAHKVVTGRRVTARVTCTSTGTGAITCPS